MQVGLKAATRVPLLFVLLEFRFVIQFEFVLIKIGTYNFSLSVIR